jgi:hypothetical protein
MTKEEFIDLSIADRTEYLWNYGECISQKTYYHANLSLFRVNNFFVEVFLHRLRSEIIGVEIQENPQILFEYVKDLELSELFDKKEDC